MKEQKKDKSEKDAGWMKSSHSDTNMKLLSKRTDQKARRIAGWRKSSHSDTNMKLLRKERIKRREGLLMEKQT
ncbi:hypothetical protein TNCT_320501 [Trichonephila clavata]|uniref:Uncharacterized protein n=1 Tax=Trichonephila clavata TaxID=2740835 RepID=A0A8X6IJH0_TRICU|nr:hypothetical protein TNCT_320501 [Trichonephila clavata]